MTYGLPAGANITYGSPGFPDWVYRLADHFGLQASTYPGHQETDRNEAGYNPNPNHLNRGIDWRGPVTNLERFAEYLMSITHLVEQVIWENPKTGKRYGVGGRRDVTKTGYYDYDGGYNAHRDHLHTRQDEAIPLPGAAQPGGTPVGFQGDPVWLEDVLRKRLGDRLVVHDGWKEYGTGGVMGDIWGVMIHHTGNRNEKWENIRNGRPDLRGPLSQGLITPDGKFHLVAVGPCNHAGVGSYKDLTDGNRRAIGFECAWPTVNADGSFNKSERWPDAQVITMRDATAAVLEFLKYGSDRVCGHKEYNRVDGKWDPGNMDMNWFRGEVAKDLAGQFDTASTPELPKPLPYPADHTGLVFDQTCGRWEMLGWRTEVEVLAAIGQKLGIEGCDPALKGFRRP